jgi:hypothetical protein
MTKEWIDPKDVESGYSWTTEELRKTYENGGVGVYNVALLDNDDELLVYYFDSQTDDVKVDRFVPKPDERFVRELGYSGWYNIMDNGFSIAKTSSLTDADFIVAALRKTYSY